MGVATPKASIIIINARALSGLHTVWGLVTNPRIGDQSPAQTVGPGRGATPRIGADWPTKTKKKKKKKKNDLES